MRQEVLRLQLSFHVRLPGVAPPEFVGIALVPVQQEQCLSNVIMVPVSDSTVTEDLSAQCQYPFRVSVQQRQCPRRSLVQYRHQKVRLWMFVPFCVEAGSSCDEKGNARQSLSCEAVLNSVCLSRAVRARAYCGSSLGRVVLGCGKRLFSSVIVFCSIFVGWCVCSLLFIRES